MFKTNKDFVETLKQVLMKSFLVLNIKNSLTIDFAGIKKHHKQLFILMIVSFFLKVKLVKPGACLKPVKEGRSVSKFQNVLMK